jgi:hypothetical protein
MTRFIGVGMDEKFTGGVTFIYIYINLLVLYHPLFPPFIGVGMDE